MMKNKTWVLGFLSALILCAIGIAQDSSVVEDASSKWNRDLAETKNFTLGRPVQPALTPDGSAVIFLRSGPRDPVLHLYELQVSTGKVEELIAPDTLLSGGVEHLTKEERARRERMRVTARGFTDFVLSKDGSEILLTLSGRLYVLMRRDRHVVNLPSEGWIDPSFSEDGRFVAAVRDGDLYAIDIATATERRLTSGASGTLTRGVAEFAAEEEMDRHHGKWWSPDSKWIVYQETDVSQVEKHYISDPLDPQEASQMYYYPRAGTANARVRLGVIARTGGPTIWIRWDAEKYPYLARVVWTESAPLTILVQTRDQREEKLLTVDPKTGVASEILTETDPAWIDLDPDNRIPYWFKDGSAFLWTTERRGGRQIELRSRDGSLLRELTPADCLCADFIDVDETSGTLITSGGPDPREVQLYRVSLKGGAPVRITQESGHYEAVFSEDHGTYVSWSSLSSGAWKMQVHGRNDSVLADVPSAAETPPFAPRIELTQAGPQNFNAAIVRPSNFQRGTKYPVILDVYAGPTSREVSAPSLDYVPVQWMADQGFIVVKLDGRGTPRRGRDWERVVQGNLIDIALEDQVAGLIALGEKYPELDMTRVGVNGWSFGGYFAAMATLRRPDVFACGVAGAPVVDWEDYDTHYTERYMGLPSANPEGYRKANVLTYVGRLERPLLLIHGFEDDNVYVEHTMKLARALFEAGKQFEFLPLTGTHMVPDPVVKARLNSRIMAFFKAHLQPHGK